MHWDSSLETGIPLVDRQHKLMFDRLDILLDKYAKDRVSEALDFLGDYALKHFGCEEMMMKCSKFPHFEEHKRLHEAFVEKYVELKTEYEKSGDDMLLLLKITRFVLGWLRKHIMESDKAFSEYFRDTQGSGGGADACQTREMPHSA